MVSGCTPAAPCTPLTSKKFNRAGNGKMRFQLIVLRETLVYRAALVKVEKNRKIPTDATDNSFLIHGLCCSKWGMTKEDSQLSYCGRVWWNYGWISQLCVAITRLLTIPVSLTALSGTVRLGLYFPVCIGEWRKQLEIKLQEWERRFPSS